MSANHHLANSNVESILFEVQDELRAIKDTLGWADQANPRIVETIVRQNMRLCDEVMRLSRVLVTLAGESK